MSRGVVLVLAWVSLVPIAAVPPGGCPDETPYELSGTVVDEATGAPLAEVTSVGLADASGGDLDGDGAPAGDGTWGFCVEPGFYQLSFHADSYFPELWDDVEPGGAATVIEVIDADVTGLVAGLTAYPVLTGRVVDDRSGEDLFASIGIEAVDGSFADGEGTDASGGEFRITVREPGDYLLSFFVDSHWAEWYDDANKRSRATPIEVRRDSGVIDLGDIGVRHCGRPGPDFCVPRNFSN